MSESTDTEADWISDPTAFYLAYVAMVIRKGKWVPRSVARSNGIRATADEAMEAMATARINEMQADLTPTPDDWSMAIAATKWIRKLDPEDVDNDFMRQQISAAKEANVTSENMAVLATVVRAYGSRSTKIISSWIGREGERVSNLNMSCVAVEAVDGGSNRHWLRDRQNNLVAIIMLNDDQLVVGARCTIRSGVVSGRTYRKGNEKATLISDAIIATETGTTRKGNDELRPSRRASRLSGLFPSGNEIVEEVGAEIVDTQPARKIKVKT
jgi:hypothetical protein